MKVGRVLLYGGIVAGVGTAAYFLFRNRNSQSVSSPYKGVKLSDYFSVTDKAGAAALPVANLPVVKNFINTFKPTT